MYFYLFKAIFYGIWLMVSINWGIVSVSVARESENNLGKLSTVALSLTSFLFLPHALKYY